jgi:hypothetical protein
MISLTANLCHLCRNNADLQGVTAFSFHYSTAPGVPYRLGFSDQTALIGLNSARAVERAQLL